MKKILIGSAIMILAFVLYTSAAFAATFGGAQASYDPASQIVTVSGSISSGGGKTVCVTIREPSGNIIYINETTSNANGSFSFKHSLQPEAAEGAYLVSVGGTGVSNLVTRAFIVGDLQGKIDFLQSIKIDDIAIEGFDPDDTIYRAAVAPDAQSILITAVPEQRGATVKINGQTAAGESPFGPITLCKGENNIQIEVTSQDGTNTKTYSLIIVAESGAEPEKSAEDLITGLIDKINGMDIHKGTKNSLASKLENVLKSIQKGNRNSSVNQLEAFIHEVNAQTGKKLTPQQGNELIAEANDIISVITESD